MISEDFNKILTHLIFNVYRSVIEYIDRQTHVRGKIPIKISGGRLYGLTVASDNCLNQQNMCMYNQGSCDKNQLCLPTGYSGRTCL